MEYKDIELQKLVIYDEEKIKEGRDIFIEEMKEKTNFNHPFVISLPISSVRIDGYFFYVIKNFYLYCFKTGIPRHYKYLPKILYFTIQYDLNRISMNDHHVVFYDERKMLLFLHVSKSPSPLCPVFASDLKEVKDIVKDIIAQALFQPDTFEQYSEQCQKVLVDIVRN